MSGARDLCRCAFVICKVLTQQSMMELRKWLKQPALIASSNTASTAGNSSSDHGDITLPAATVVDTNVLSPDSPALPASPTEAEQPPSLPQTPPPLGGPQVPEDLGKTEPAQVYLKKYPTRLYSGVRRSFCSSWFKNRDWLEYSCKNDAIFCRHFGSSKSDAFTTTVQEYQPLSPGTHLSNSLIKIKYFFTFGVWKNMLLNNFGEYL